MGEVIVNKVRGAVTSLGSPLPRGQCPPTCEGSSAAQQQEVARWGSPEAGGAQDILSPH